MYCLNLGVEGLMAKVRAMTRMVRRFRGYGGSALVMTMISVFVRRQTKSKSVIALTAQGLSAPRITKFLPQVVMNSSQDVELVCAVAGSPLPDVVWSRDGQRLCSCASQLPSLRKTCQSWLAPRYTFSWIGSGSRLHIENAFALFDAGEFTCTVVSPLGRKEANATLTLRGEERTMSTHTEQCILLKKGQGIESCLF